MKSTLKIAVSLSLFAALAACGPNKAQPTPSATPTPAAATAAPTATPTGGATGTPTAAPTATPATGTPTAAPTPTNPPSALPTPPPTQADFSITGATATKNSDFSYTMTLTGQGLGAVENYSFLQVKASFTTVTIVKDGKFQLNAGLKEASLTPTELKFRYVFDNSPTTGDLVQISFTRTDGTSGKSSELRLVADR